MQSNCQEVAIVLFWVHSDTIPELIFDRVCSILEEITEL